MRGRTLVALLLLLVGSAYAAESDTHYVRDGAAGTATGADWANAFTNLPVSLTRGDTYYVADGSYGYHDFDDAESGAATITVKKATGSDHGTDTGWQASYGDGQAEFTKWMIRHGSYTFDGQVGIWASNWPGYVQHGFKIAKLLDGVNDWKLIQIGATDDRVSNLTISHVEAAFLNTGIGTGPGAGWVPGSDGVYFYGSTNLTFDHLWIHNISRVNFYYISGTNVTLEYSFLEENGTGQKTEEWGDIEHSQILNWGGASAGGENSTYRYNVLRKFRSTGGLTVYQLARDSYIYGNIFLQGEPDAIAGTRILGGFSDGCPTNVWFYNNTFANITAGGGIGYGGDWTNCYARNNLFYQVSNGVYAAGITWSHSWYLGNDDRSGETSVQIGIGDPFVDLAGSDYRLAAATESGFTTGLNSTDPLGITRGAGGTWDRGAYEFVGATHYVLEGASGDGTSWSSPLGALPASLTRGDTYYVGDGTNYGAYEFDDAVSGTDYITVKKATASDHGTETGWNSGYGDGQAVFSGRQRFTRGYYVFDGGAFTSWMTNYGFNLTGSATTQYGFYIDTTTEQITHVTIRGVWIDMSGSMTWTNADFVKCVKNDNGDSILISNCYLKNFGDAISSDASTNSVYEYCYFDRSATQDGNADHGDALVFSNGSESTVRYCQIHWNGQQIFFSGTTTAYTNFFVHNNLFYGRESGSQGVVKIDENTLTNLFIYNNTFAKMATYLFSGSGFYGEVKNNILYNCANYNFTTFTHSTNWFLTGTDVTEDGAQFGPNPFVSTNTASYNFALTNTATTAIDTGVNLGATYADDITGTTRGAAWDMGAYEYAGETPPPPAAGTNTIFSGGIFSGGILR